MGLTRELAASWGRADIRVNAIAPGFFHSRLADPAIRPGRAVDQGEQPDSARRRRRRAQGRRGVPRRRRLQLHHRPDHRRRRGTRSHCLNRPYAARPWLEHYDYWVRPHLTYPGGRCHDILARRPSTSPTARRRHFLGAELTFRELKRRADALRRRAGAAAASRRATASASCCRTARSTSSRRSPILRLGAHHRQHQPDLHGARSR